MDQHAGRKALSLCYSMVWIGAGIINNKFNCCNKKEEGEVVDFEELKDESHNKNVKKNRATLIALFVIFFTPVIIAYSAYFTGHKPGQIG